jgi:hypothetical protein
MSHYDSDYDYVSDERGWEEAEKAKRDSFEPSGDTHFRMTLDEYKAKFVELGFEEVLHETFPALNRKVDVEESFYVYAHRDGFLITFDTYAFEDDETRTPTLNYGNVYYCWAPSGDPVRVGPHTSSGSFAQYPEDNQDDIRPIWIGYHDVREGIKYAMDDLKANGEIIMPWVKNPINWLASNQSVRDENRATGPGLAARAEWDRWLAEIKAKSLANYDKLPDWVKAMIGPLDHS